MSKESVAALNTHLRTIHTLAALLNRVDSNPSLDLIHGCAAVLLRESQMAMEQIDLLDEILIIREA